GSTTLVANQYNSGNMRTMVDPMRPSIIVALVASTALAACGSDTTVNDSSGDASIESAGAAGTTSSGAAGAGTGGGGGQGNDGAAESSAGSGGASGGTGGADACGNSCAAGMTCACPCPSGPRQAFCLCLRPCIS